MAVSGSTDFELDVAEYVEEAFERCGLEARTGYDLKTAKRSLNLMLADWANRGLNQWTIKQRTQALTASDRQYDMLTDVIDVLSVVVRRDGTDFTMDRISRDTYLAIPTKTTTGRPTQFYLQRSVTPKIFFYPTPDSTSTYTFKYQALTRIQDAGDDYTNNPEVPFRFLPCLISGLAYYLAMKFNPDKMIILKQVYDEEWTRAAAEDRDSVSLHLVPGGN